jgi:hypothetical protein
VTDSIGPTVHDTWTLYKGDTWQLQFTCQNVDTTAMTLPDGVAITWKLDDLNKTNNWITRSLGSGITIIDADAGICLVEVDVSLTAKLIITSQPYVDELTITKGTTSTGQPRVLTMSVGQILVAQKAK